MNEYNYTQNSIKALQTAQAMAQENGNQYLTPEHLLYALLDQDGGLIGTLFTRMGVDARYRDVISSGHAAAHYCMKAFHTDLFCNQPSALCSVQQS